MLDQRCHDGYTPMMDTLDAKPHEAREMISMHEETARWMLAHFLNGADIAAMSGDCITALPLACKFTSLAFIQELGAARCRPTRPPRHGRRAPGNANEPC